jgi:hypothetical protein
MTDGIDTRVLAVLLWPSAAMLAAMLAVIAWAGYLTVVAPGDLRGPYIVLLLFQSFAASTGYAQRARRGHFDQLLAGPPSRLRFAVTHALISTAVGAVAWTTISVLDAIGAGGRSASRRRRSPRSSTFRRSRGPCPSHFPDTRRVWCG